MNGTSLVFLYVSFQGKYYKAEQLFKRCIAIEERTQGPDHHDLASSLYNLGRILRSQVEVGEAIGYFSGMCDELHIIIYVDILPVIEVTAQTSCVAPYSALCTLLRVSTPRRRDFTNGASP